MTKHSVIIIGSGPAALGAAKSLERAKIDYIILERESYPGGIPVTCSHPSFGITVYKRPMTGAAFAKKLTKNLDFKKIKLNTTVLKIHNNGIIEARNSKGLIKYQADNIVLATGCRETHRHGRLTTGLRPEEIFTTGSLQRFVKSKQPLPFKNPLIVGTEIVGLSALMTCFSSSVKPAAMIEESNRIDTYMILKLLPMLKGVPVYYNAKISDIKGIEHVESVTVDIMGQKRIIKCDGIIFTGKFVAENTLVYGSDFKNFMENKILKVDKNGRTEQPNLWACGNMLHPGDRGDICYLEGVRLGNQIVDI